jgi:bifunctional non-homologous end joining protein LigD
MPGASPEAQDAAPPSGPRLLYVIHKHDASRLHYDLRLELNGVLKSWAVPKGPCLDPSQKRLAVHVEDHPVEYGQFEGTIPEGEYGGGTVMLWDEGTWEPIGDAPAAYAAGTLRFRLRGRKLQGDWKLVRFRGRTDDGDNWLLIKSKDDYARPLAKADILKTDPDSVATGRTLEQIARGENATR